MKGSGGVGEGGGVATVPSVGGRARRPASAVGPQPRLPPLSCGAEACVRRCLCHRLPSELLQNAVCRVLLPHPRRNFRH